jgi:flagellar biosynthesis GTPase FlhF
MQIKSYFANRVELAVGWAHAELGEDAVLIQSKLAEGDARSLGKYEVVFGLSNPLASREEPIEDPDGDEDEFLLRAANAVSDIAPSQSRTRPSQSVRINRLTQPLPEAELRVPSAWEPGAIAFVGPAGGGKTASLMKLAFALTAVRKRKVRIIEIQDTVTGGSPLLQRFTEILELPFVSRRFPTREDVVSASDSHSVLIDTPALSPAQTDDSNRLSKLLSQIQGLRTQLVIPSWVSPAAAPMLLSAAKALTRPSHLLLTHAETAPADCARILAEAFGLPVSLVTTGREPQSGFVNLPGAQALARTGRAA